MSGFQQVIILGNVGQDPEEKWTQGGTQVASFSLATSRRPKAGEDEVTTWHRCKAFGKTAEVICAHVHKGDTLFVEGRLDPWKTDGGKSGVDIIVEHFSFTGGGRRDRDAGAAASARGASRAPASTATRGAQRGPAPSRNSPPPADDFADDDIPF